MDRLHELETAFANAPAAPLIAGGVLLLFGWCLYRIVLMAAGGVLGAAIGMGLAQLAGNLFELAGKPLLIAWIAGAAAGMIAGVLVFHFLHNAAFFLTGAFVGTWAFVEGLRLFRAMDFEWAKSEVIFAFGAPLAGVLSGLLMIWLSDWLIALVSAAAGTLLVLGAIDWPLAGIPGIVLFGAGAVIQLGIASRLKRRKGDE